MGKQGTPTELMHARDVASEAMERLEGVRQISRTYLAGSVRRRKQTVSDIDLVAVSSLGDLSVLGMDGGFRWTPRGAVGDIDGVRVEVYGAYPATAGACLLYATGPGDLNVFMRMKAKRRGWKLSQNGLVDAETGVRVDEPSGDAYRDEDEIFRRLDMKILDAEVRSHWKEILGR